MSRKYFYIGCVLASLWGCQSQDDAVTGDGLVPVDLALSLTATAPQTRMADDVVKPTTGNAVGALQIIPFAAQGTNTDLPPITKDDRPRFYTTDGNNSAYDHTESNPQEKFIYRQQFSFMPGVASFLVYAKAAAQEPPTGMTAKAYNGSLYIDYDGHRETFVPERAIPADLQFKPDQMYPNATVTPPEASLIAKYLTDIANTYGVNEEGRTERWALSTNSWLRALYLNFINQGNQTAAVLPGSAASIKAYVSRLYRVMGSNNFAEGTMERAIADEVMRRIEMHSTLITQSYSESGKSLTVTMSEVNSERRVTSLGGCDTYPGNYDLPDGAAVLLWDGAKFTVQTGYTTINNINNIDRFAYPAELFYHANSRIKTSNTEIAQSVYQTYAQSNNWEMLLSRYPYNNAIISSSTKAAIIKDRLQYGVAQLSATVQATAGTLKDINGTDIDLTNLYSLPSFQITGIIVGNQHPVGFDFKPLPDTDAEVRFVYDRCLNTNTTEDGMFYLSTTAQGPLKTLVLQTPENDQSTTDHDESDVPIILELHNYSGYDFKGKNGIIYANTKFYLVGKINPNNGTKPSTMTDDEYDKTKGRVFTQDRTTTLTLQVPSLAYAYNVLPNLLDSKLEIGVQVKLPWQQATPVNVILE